MPEPSDSRDPSTFDVKVSGPTPHVTAAPQAGPSIWTQLTSLFRRLFSSGNDERNA